MSDRGVSQAQGCPIIGNGPNPHDLLTADASRAPRRRSSLHGPTRISVGSSTASGPCARGASPCTRSAAPRVFQPPPAFFSSPPAFVTDPWFLTMARAQRSRLLAQGQCSLANIKCPPAQRCLPPAQGPASLGFFESPRHKDDVPRARVPVPCVRTIVPRHFSEAAIEGRPPRAQKRLSLAHGRASRGFLQRPLHGDGVPCAKTTNIEKMPWITRSRSRVRRVALTPARGERASRASAGSRRTRPSFRVRPGKTLAQARCVRRGVGCAGPAGHSSLKQSDSTDPVSW